MKFLVVLSVAVACVVADVSHIDSQAPIVRSSYELNPEGSFQYAYETGNGIAAQAQGAIRPGASNENPSIEVNGAYKYQSPEGIPIELTYVANEYGFQPQGAHLPVAPAVPDAIRRSIEYIRSHPLKQQ